MPTMTRTRAPRYKVKKTHSTGTMKKLMRQGWTLESSIPVTFLGMTTGYNYILKKEKL